MFDLLPVLFMIFFTNLVPIWFMYDLFLHNDNVYEILWIDEKKYLVLKWSEVDFKKCQTTCSCNYIYVLTHL